METKQIEKVDLKNLFERIVAENDNETMDSDESLDFVHITFIEQRNDSDAVKKEVREKNETVDKICKRIELQTGMEVCPFLVIFFVLNRYNLGGGIMFMLALCYVCKKESIDVSIDSVIRFFPMGFPTKEQIGKFWDDQKEGGRNAIDLETVNNIFANKTVEH